MADLKDFITTEEAARILNYHVEHVRKLMREGGLKGEKMGTAWLVLKESVESYIKDTEGLNKFDPRRRRQQPVGLVFRHSLRWLPRPRTALLPPPHSRSLRRQRS